MNAKVAGVFCFLAVNQVVLPLDIPPIIDILTCKDSDPIAKLYHHTATEKILLGNGSDIELNPDLPTFFIIHGWTEDTNLQIYVDIANALLNEVESNVILVDYGVMADYAYHCAPKMVELVGQFVGKFISEAYQNGRMDLNKVNLIGHSLGSHVSGIAGKEVIKLTGEKVRRISGLDPAGPLFAIPLQLRPGSALKPTDAIFVDAIHTTILIGTIEPMGTVDIYAKGLVGSTIQLPCIANPYFTCSHAVSKDYYLESVTSCAIMAKNINNNTMVVPYGLHMPEDISGTFTFTPNMRPPYGKGDPECH